jgi:ABC-type multidrug transport system fused ATPase/permease subunit
MINITLRDYRNILVRYLAPLRWRVLGLAVLLLISTGLQLISPQLVRHFIDQATVGAALEGLIITALIFIGVALLTQVATVVVTYLSEYVSWTATNELRSDLALHCMQLDMPFHKKYTPGALIERIDGDVTALSNFFSQFVLRVLGSALLLVGTLALLYREEWRVGLALTLFAIVAMAILVFLRNTAVPSMTAEREASAGLYGLIEERLSGIDDVRANGSGSFAVYRLHQAIQNYFRKDMRSAMAGTTAWMATMGLFAVGYGLALGLGAYFFGEGIITLGTVYLFFQYTQMLRQPLEQFADQIRELQKATASIGRVQQLYFTHSQLHDDGTTPLPSGPLSVEFQGVTFAYDDDRVQTTEAELSQKQHGALNIDGSSVVGRPSSDELVLDRVNFSLAPGEVLGLLGRTGSGKTTITRLLFRLYDLNGGVIKLGGVDIRTVPLAILRQRVGIVTQEVQLFRASVRDNLTLFDDRIADEKIWAVLDDLGMGDWARRLSKGLDSEIAAGEGLSAGEAQLLAFARAFLNDPGLVILDEASSRLDPATERLIERAVDKLLHNRTAIIIAHRLATVQRADTILILDQGRVREHGARKALLQDERSRFSELMQVGMEEVLV